MPRTRPGRRQDRRRGDPRRGRPRRGGPSRRPRSRQAWPPAGSRGPVRRTPQWPRREVARPARRRRRSRCSESGVPSVSGLGAAPWIAVSPPSSAATSAYFTTSPPRPSPSPSPRTSAGLFTRRRSSSGVSSDLRRHPTGSGWRTGPFRPCPGTRIACDVGLGQALTMLKWGWLWRLMRPGNRRSRGPASMTCAAPTTTPFGGFEPLQTATMRPFRTRTRPSRITRWLASIVTTVAPAIRIPRPGSHPEALQRRRTMRAA